MSENVLSCSSGDKEKITAHAAWIEATKKALSILAAVVVAVIAISYFVAGNIQSKISEIELKHEKALAKLQTETSIRIERLEKDVEDLKEDCKQAERDYAAARQAVTRMRRKK